MIVIIIQSAAQRADVRLMFGALGLCRVFMSKYQQVALCRRNLCLQDIDRIMLIHGSRVMESVKPILDGETRTEDVKEQVKEQVFSYVTQTYGV